MKLSGAVGPVQMCVRSESERLLRAVGAATPGVWCGSIRQPNLSLELLEADHHPDVLQLTWDGETALVLSGAAVGRVTVVGGRWDGKLSCSPRMVWAALCSVLVEVVPSCGVLVALANRVHGAVGDHLIFPGGELTALWVEDGQVWCCGFPPTVAPALTERSATAVWSLDASMASGAAPSDRPAAVRALMASTPSASHGPGRTDRERFELAADVVANLSCGTLGGKDIDGRELDGLARALDLRTALVTSVPTVSAFAVGSLPLPAQERKAARRRR